MKSKCLKSVLISTFTLLFIFLINDSNVNAQKSGSSNKKTSQNQMQGKDTTKVFGKLKLKPEQKKAIFDARIKFIKETTPLKNQIREKMAHLKTLSTTDKPDINAINSTIDEIGSLKTQIMKLSMTHKMVVRSLLNDEQKAIFDSRGGRFGRQFGKHNMKQRSSEVQNKPNQSFDNDIY